MKFFQIVKVHQETVDGYLANVAGIAIHSTADKIAQNEMDNKAREVDAKACELEVNRDARTSELIAADIVHNFLIPEVIIYQLNFIILPKWTDFYRAPRHKWLGDCVQCSIHYLNFHH